MWEEWKGEKKLEYLFETSIFVSQKYNVHHVYSVLEIIELLAE